MHGKLLSKQQLGLKRARVALYGGLVFATAYEIEKKLLAPICIHVLGNLTLFSLPYVETNASAGTMKGQKGIQDLTLTLKYMPIEKTIGKSTYSVYALANVSAPLSNYPADYLPLSIGMQSKTASLRLMGDYQRGNFFATLSGAYVKRANSTIDRNSYLTNDEVHYTNEVDMPDAISVNFRTGYRSNRLIAELVLDNWVTQSGGFDITKNNMPFPSNTMNALRYGVNSKYTFKKIYFINTTMFCILLHLVTLADDPDH